MEHGKLAGILRGHIPQPQQTNFRVRPPYFDMTPLSLSQVFYDREFVNNRPDHVMATSLPLWSLELYVTLLQMNWSRH